MPIPYRGWEIELGVVESDNRRQVVVYQTGKAGKVRLGKHYHTRALKVAESYIDGIIDHPETASIMER